MNASSRAESVLLNSRPAHAETYPPFYSLNDQDPVTAGGVTSAMVTEWLGNGWTVTLKTTTTAAPDRIVRFRNHTTGELEWRQGTVPAGTQYYVLSNMGFKLDEVVKPCGNQSHQDTPLENS